MPWLSYDGTVTVPDLRRRCGQLLSVGFDGPAASPALLDRISRSEVGSVMLFRPNIVDPLQVAELVTTLRVAGPADWPLVVATDQEGGLVQRIRAPLTAWPPMMTVAAAGDLVRTEAVGRALGQELAALGVAWTFAPVLDVNTNPDNPVIGNRAFGNTTAAVSAHALAFWRGLRSAGVRGCGKHYPGHGDTHMDSHHDLPTVSHPETRLRSIELATFAEAIAAGAEALMTAHVLYPALDADHPATLSPRIATAILRNELGFQGLLVSDDLGMKAVAARWSIEQLVVEGLQAGVDHFLIRGPVERQVAAFEALIHAAESSVALRERVHESAARVATFKAGLSVPLPAQPAALDALDLVEHRALAASFDPDGRDHRVGLSPVSLD